jgi:hypothetical protein
VVEQRGKLLLEVEPDGARSVLDVREAFKQPEQVVVVGKIGGVPNPWSKGRAAFVMIDPAMDHDSDNCHDPGCPHCALKREKKKLQATALVEFVQDGTVVPIEAQTLFRVKEGQTVVVRGQAKLNEASDTLVIEADGLHVRE